MHGLTKARGLSLGSPRGNSLQYWQKLKNIFVPNLVGFWPLWEVSGAIAYDKSGNSRNGTYTGITLANREGPSGHLIGYSNGSAGNKVTVTNVPSAAEGGFGGWARMDAGQWATGVSNNFARFFTDNNNAIIFSKSAANNLTIDMKRGVTSQYYTFTFKPLDWFHMFVTWSQAANRVRYYLNSMLVETDTNIGSWIGATGYVRLYSNDGASQLKGWLDSWALIGGAEPTQSQVNSLASTTKIFRLSVLGDSISASDLSGSWVWLVLTSWHGGTSMRINHAVSGHSISANMLTQVAAAANDNADVIITHFGTNDDDAGDMAVLQSKYAEGLASLKASNPSAKIYAMNVLPRWSDNIGTTPIAKGNIRTAIAAACASQNIDCWDTVTVPWINASDTTDGIHPNNTGCSKISVQILSRI